MFMVGGCCGGRRPPPRAETAICHCITRNVGSITKETNHKSPNKRNLIRVTYYIPQDAINAYPGTLTQNPTDDSGVIMK